MSSSPVTTHFRQGFRVLEVDTKRIIFKSRAWRDLGSWGKQKFDNVLFLEHMNKEPKLLVKIIYKT